MCRWSQNTNDPRQIYGPRCAQMRLQDLYDPTTARVPQLHYIRLLGACSHQKTDGIFVQLDSLKKRRHRSGLGNAKNTIPQMRNE